MRFFFFLVFLAIVAMIVVYKYQESHPSQSKGLFNYDFREKDQEEERKPSLYRVLEVYSPGAFLLLRDNVETQRFALVDLDVPNQDPDKNDPKAFDSIKTKDELAAIGREALEFVKSQIMVPSGLRASARKREEKDGAVYVQGDLILTNGMSLSRQLVMKGLAKGKSDGLVSYASYEEDARMEKRGIWSQKLALKDRVKVRVDIQEKVLEHDYHAQKASMSKEILESSINDEVAVAVNLDFAIAPPVTRTYNFEVKCSFMIEEITGYSEKTKKETRVYREIETKNLNVEVSSAKTNVTVQSAGYVMSKISRGGKIFRQGVFCSSCLCVVSLDGEEIKKENKIF